MNGYWRNLFIDYFLIIWDEYEQLFMASLIYAIVNAEEYNTGATSDANSVGVTAVNATTLRFTLHSPSPTFAKNLAYPTIRPVRKDIINSDPDWDKTAGFVGNGAYAISFWADDHFLVLEKMAFYHSAGQVSLDKIILNSYSVLKNNCNLVEQS